MESFPVSEKKLVFNFNLHSASYKLFKRLNFIFNHFFKTELFIFYSEVNLMTTSYKMLTQEHKYQLKMDCI